MNTRSLFYLTVVLAITSPALGAVADFENITLAPESYYNGSDSAGGFSSNGAWLVNNYDTNYFSWDGFACSNITDTAASGWGAQYNAITGSGQGGSANYAVGYVGFVGLPTVTFSTPRVVQEISVTNNNYAYYSMLNGDAFAKQFGGESGEDPDWYMLPLQAKTSPAPPSEPSISTWLIFNLPTTLPITFSIPGNPLI